MLHLEVLVPENRDRTAVVTLSDGMRRIREETGVATAAEKIAAAHGNPDCNPLRPCGHPPYGSYLLLRHASAPEGCGIEYGSDVLLFEARDGSALEAESFGRLALLVYAGPAGRDARMRRTQGGVRLSKAMMGDIAARLGPDGDIDLRIGPLGADRAWWQFWKPRHTVQLQPLSSEAPHLVAPPLDELSVMAALLQGTQTRRQQRGGWDRDDGSRFDISASSSTDSGTEPFRGGGGEYAGAGATGSWGSGPASADRGTGVDASGRILGGAAGIGAMTAMAAAADTVTSRADPGDGPSAASGAGGDTDTGTGTSY
jgi:hypothetical protein